MVAQIHGLVLASRPYFILLFYLSLQIVTEPTMGLNSGP